MPEVKTRTTWVYADTVGRARCRDARCGAAITWAEIVTSGKKMCFTGELVALRTDDRDGRQVAGRDTRDRDLQAAGWEVLHFSYAAFTSNPLACINTVRQRLSDKLQAV